MDAGASASGAAAFKGDGDPVGLEVAVRGASFGGEGSRSDGVSDCALLSWGGVRVALAEVVGDLPFDGVGDCRLLEWGGVRVALTGELFDSVGNCGLIAWGRAKISLTGVGEDLSVDGIGDCALIAWDGVMVALTGVGEGVSDGEGENVETVEGTGTGTGIATGTGTGTGTTGTGNGAAAADKSLDGSSFDVAFSSGFDAIAFFGVVTCRGAGGGMAAFAAF